MFSIRFDFRNPGFAGVSMAERYESAMDMALWAESFGAVDVTLSEGHGMDDGFLPSPLQMAAAMAARTETIRFTLAAVLAPFYDPLRLAEDVLVLDNLSRGRVDLVIAAGGGRREFAAYGVPMSERVRRVREVVSTLRGAFSGGPFDYRGRSVRLTPGPYSPGGPTLMLGGSAPPAARRAARIADGFLPADPSLWDTYRDELSNLGKPDPGPYFAGDPRVVVLHTDPDVAWSEWIPYFLHDINQYGAWAADADGAPLFQPLSNIDDVKASGLYRVLTPSEYVTELHESPVAYTLLHPMVGGAPPELAWNSLRLYEHDVLPRL